MRKRGAERGINDGRREGIPYYIIYKKTHPGPPWEGEREGGAEIGKRKSASKREQRKCIYSAEREQVQDDGVGLKRKTNIPPPELRSSVQRRTEKCSPQRVQKHIQCFF